MKPVWEEEWSVEDDALPNEVWAKQAPPWRSLASASSVSVGKFDDPDRAKLAAQAPRMARWVLQWHCKLSSADPRRIEAESVLRAAGVLP